MVSESDEEFEKRYEQMVDGWPEQFIAWFNSRVGGKPRSNREMMKKCMIAKVRTEAKLGKPPVRYSTNQVESMHNVIKGIDVFRTKLIS